MSGWSQCRQSSGALPHGCQQTGAACKNSSPNFHQSIWNKINLLLSSCLEMSEKYSYCFLRFVGHNHGILIYFYRNNLLSHLLKLSYFAWWNILRSDWSNILTYTWRLDHSNHCHFYTYKCTMRHKFTGAGRMMSKNIANCRQLKKVLRTNTVNKWNAKWIHFAVKMWFSLLYTLFCLHFKIIAFVRYTQFDLVIFITKIMHNLNIK